MLNYEFSDFYWLYLILFMINSIFFFISDKVIHYFNKKYYSVMLADGTVAYFCFISIAFGFLAMTIGLLIGTSKSPVVGVVIPSILTFYAGLMTYLFIFSNKESKIKDSIAIVISMISLSISLIVGADYGASMRMKAMFMESESAFRRELEIIQLEHNIKNNNISIEKPTLNDDTLKMNTK